MKKLKDKEKKVRYSGIQPQYFPRLHYFARILNADVFVLRDDCQYVNSHKFPDGTRGKSYQSHTPIKLPEGVNLLTVPVSHDGLLSIAETKILYQDNWNIKHIKTFKNYYSKSKYFNQIHEEITKILTTPYKTLADLNIATVCWGILKILGESTSKDHLTVENVVDKLKKNKKFRLKNIYRGSTFPFLKDPISANEKIIKICKEVGATEDYSGGTAVSAYVDHKFFDDNGVKITVQDWKCKQYTQMFAKQREFIPNLSIIDLLMNESTDQIQNIISG